jgi:acyl-CoA thioester hydrolase
VTRACTSSIRVRYAETDQAGIAYHGGYLAWFEVGRTDLLRGEGLTYRELETEGVRLPVIEAHARFFKPALYDDVLEVHTQVAEVSGATIRFEYQVRRGDLETPLATGFTAHAAVDLAGRARRLPESLRRRLA